MRNCISCGRPLKINLGGVHLFCALKHTHLSVLGWILFLLGYIFPTTQDNEAERILSIIRRVQITKSNRKKREMLQDILKYIAL